MEIKPVSVNLAKTHVDSKILSMNNFYKKINRHFVMKSRLKMILFIAFQCPLNIFIRNEPHNGRANKNGK